MARGGAEENESEGWASRSGSLGGVGEVELEQISYIMELCRVEALAEPPPSPPPPKEAHVHHKGASLGTPVTLRAFVSLRDPSSIKTLFFPPLLFSCPKNQRDRNRRGRLKNTPKGKKVR